MKIVRVVPEICSQADRQTNKQTVLCCDCVYMSGSAGVQEETSSVAGEDVGWLSEDIDG